MGNDNQPIMQLSQHSLFDIADAIMLLAVMSAGYYVCFVCGNGIGLLLIIAALVGLLFCEFEQIDRWCKLAKPRLSRNTRHLLGLLPCATSALSLSLWVLPSADAGVAFVFLCVTVIAALVAGNLKWRE